MSLNVEGLTRETALLKVKEYFENNPDPEGGNSIAIFKLKVEEWYNYGLREESRIHFVKE